MFGASRTLDIYYAAFRVPDFIYTIMLLFTASTAIIPIFLEKYAEKKDSAAAEAFLGSLISFFTVLVVIIAVFAFFLMPVLMPLFLPGFSAGDMQSAVLLGRILLLSPVFLGLSNIISSATQSFNRFFVYGLSGVFYNFGIIIGIVVFYKWWGLAGLVWGVALGAFFHMAIQIPSLTSVGIRPKFSMRWDRDIRHIAWLSLPRTLGLGISQLTLTALTAMASVLASGSIAVFNLALNLQSIPITIIGLSYSVAAFPALASFSLKKARSHFEEHFKSAFLHILFWALPFSVLLLVLRAQVVRTILGSGNFSWPDTRLTAASLFILSLAVVFQSLFYLLVRAFYADGESW
ncbi:MAG: lipid II flippase MurJ, partial [Candidatus Wolfebacteria bacterium]|nr:lipid II flippase MurJ [Candidatus Wolfebacteria bacterium]